MILPEHQVKLETVFEHETTNPYVVIDCRVQVFQILSKLTYFIQNYAELKDQPYEVGSEDYQVLLLNLAKAYWMSILNDPLPWLPSPKKGYKVLVVDDWKYANGVYWRSNHVDSYKGNRDPSSRPDLYYQIYDQFNQLMENPKCKIPVLRQEGFEADDFAGLLWNEWKEIPEKRRQNLFLLSVDGDWKQLVVPGCYFACARPNAFRLQSTYEVQREYFQKGIILRDTYQIVDHKVAYGDASDNLFANSPRSVIDLREPGEKPSLDVKPFLKTGVNTNKNHAKSGQKHIEQWSL